MRDPSEDEQLPDLDQIHHTAEVRQPAEVATATAPRPAPAQVGHATALRAAVQIRRIDPWATFKISAVLAVVGFFIWMIAVAVLYLVLDGMGVWDQVNSSFGTLVTADGSSSEGDVIGAGTVFGWALLLGAVATPIGGRIGDMYGKRLAILVSLGFVAAGSVACAVATSLPLFIIGRGLQGLGFGIVALGISDEPDAARQQALAAWRSR